MLSRPMHCKLPWLMVISLLACNFFRCTDKVLGEQSSLRDTFLSE